MDSIKWNNYPPSPPKQWWRREGARNAPFWHHWNGGRGGPDVPSILSKIVACVTAASPRKKIGGESPLRFFSGERRLWPRLSKSSQLVGPYVRHKRARSGTGFVFSCGIPAVREILKAWRLSILITRPFVVSLHWKKWNINTGWTLLIGNLQSTMLRRLLVKPRLTPSSCRILITNGLKTTASDETTSYATRVSAGLFCLYNICMPYDHRPCCIWNYSFVCVKIKTYFWNKKLCFTA